jgi:hypothetical protein
MFRMERVEVFETALTIGGMVVPRIYHHKHKLTTSSSKNLVLLFFLYTPVTCM